MTKSVFRFGIAGLVVSLLSVSALSAPAQNYTNARQVFKDICFRSLLGINDEVLSDSGRFPCDKDWIPAIELGERFGDFTNAVMTVRKNGDTGKLTLSDVKFVKELGIETDDKALLREYEHAVELVGNLLGAKVECSGLVDPNANARRMSGGSMDGRIRSRTIVNLAKGQMVEIRATEASYVIRSGQPIQTAAPVVEIRFSYNPYGSVRPEGDGTDAVKELTLGADCSDLLSLKMRILKEKEKLQELQQTRFKEGFKERLERLRVASQSTKAKESIKSDISVAETNNPVMAEKISVAEKLGTCEFLLNKDFKKNAKYYLCLFSASWCPPCRREMPRIAKTYAETLKDDPDIELIHFSRDQNDEKALAWAKEHDVRFPVVKPNGGNPLDLKPSGIPHLFILKADGTLVEHDHPMRIFNEEKFRELKCGGSTEGVKSRDGKDITPAIEGVENVTTEGGLFTLTGPYGIRMTADPGCEKGAEYIMKRLVEHYLPQAKEFYGDPFLGENPSRTYSIHVDRNDGLGNSQYTGPSYRPGTGNWSIGLSKGADRYEMSLDYLASSVLTLCEEPKWASFAFYVNRFVEAKAKGIDAASRLKEDIRRGLEATDEDGNDSWYRSHAPLWAVLEDLRAKHPKLILDYCVLKNKRFAEGKLPKKLSLEQMAVLLREVSGENASELFSKYGVKDSNTRRSATGGNPPVIAKSKDGKDGFKGEKSTATVDGITLSCSIQGGEATIESPTGKLYERAVAPQPVGDISIPSAVNGTPVTGIGKFALCNCPELVSVKIPNTVKSIGEWAFYGCESLAEVWIPPSVTEIGECVFANCPRLASIIVATDNPKYKVVDGVLYTKDMKCLVAGHGGLTSVMIPEGVTDINAGAFRCCRKLKSVTIPEGVRRIGKDAFCGASALESICIPSSVERIENATFWCCGEMTSLSLAEGVTSIGSRAFLSCRGLESLTIPASVKRIDPYAFEECSGLASVTMCGERPDAKDRVFSKCGKLKEIHVPANAKSWAGMKKWQGIPLVFD